MPQPFFSVIMPSFLGHYPTAAKNRDFKIFRAIDSVLGQSFKDWELVVVSDGCAKTTTTLQSNYLHHTNIHCFSIPKQPLWSGTPRNTGIFKATGKYIVYLDIDDFIGTHHLHIIHDEIQKLGEPEWVWFNDYEGNRQGDFSVKNRDINKKGQHGTCNVCHKREVAYWPDRSTYLHDFEFITLLKQSKSIPYKITTPEYYICHVPHKFDI